MEEILRLLLVDDCALLQTRSCEVSMVSGWITVNIRAENGRAALERLAQLRLDELLLDRRLPDLWSKRLTAMEHRVLLLLTRGFTNQEIADEFCVAEMTVRFHLRNIYSKLGVKTRSAVVAWAFRNGAGGKKLREE